MLRSSSYLIQVTAALLFDAILLHLFLILFSTVFILLSSGHFGGWQAGAERQCFPEAIQNVSERGLRYGLAQALYRVFCL